MRGLPLSLLVMGLALGCVTSKDEGSDATDDDWGEDDGWDGGSDDGGAGPGACEDSLRITGQFEMGPAEFPIDERIGEGLTFATEHKIDVDLFEAGCISDITLEIKLGGQGCKIDLEFEATGGGEFALSSFSFTADSYCPNFSDDLEGEYATTGSVPLTISGLPSQVEMETGTEDTVCLDDIDFRFDANGALQLAGSDTERAFELSLNLTGDYWSTGSTSADCGDETGGDETGGDESGGDESGGDETGGDDAGTPLYALDVDPDTIDFELVSVGTVVSEIVDISNSGTEPIHLNGLGVSDTTVFALSPDFAAPITLFPGMERSIQVDFEPNSTITYVGEMVFITEEVLDEDPNVLLLGAGVGAPCDICAPVIDVHPGELILDAFLTCEASDTVTVTNEGDEPLNITAVNVVNDSMFTCGSFTRSWSGPVTLEPSGSTTITVTFRATSECAEYHDLDADWNSMHIISNDPSHPDFTVALGGSATCLFGK